MSFFKSRARRRLDLIARIEDGLECRDMPEADLAALARMDGSKFNGWYHYHAAVKGGQRPLTGAAAALDAGGPVALRAYNEIMGGTPEKNDGPTPWVIIAFGVGAFILGMRAAGWI